MKMEIIYYLNVLYNRKSIITITLQIYGQETAIEIYRCGQVTITQTNYRSRVLHSERTRKLIYINVIIRLSTDENDITTTLPLLLVHQTTAQLFLF